MAEGIRSLLGNAAHIFCLSYGVRTFETLTALPRAIPQDKGMVQKLVAASGRSLYLVEGSGTQPYGASLVPQAFTISFLFRFQSLLLPSYSLPWRAMHLHTRPETSGNEQCASNIIVLATTITRTSSTAQKRSPANM